MTNPVFMRLSLNADNQFRAAQFPTDTGGRCKSDSVAAATLSARYGRDKFGPREEQESRPQVY